MADDNDRDVLGKADALLRRHSVGPPPSGSDTGGVPILTELVDAPGLDDEASKALAREVFTQVMAEVEGRIAADLENRLAQQVVPLVQAAVSATLVELRQELAGAIGEAVSRAVAQRPVK